MESVRLERKVRRVLLKVHRSYPHVVGIPHQHVHRRVDTVCGHHLHTVPEVPVGPRLLPDVLIHVEELVDEHLAGSALGQYTREVLRTGPVDAIHTVRDVVRYVSRHVLCVLHRAYILYRVVAHDGRKGAARRRIVDVPADTVRTRTV